MIKKGQILSESQFYVVDSVTATSIIVIDDDNNKIELSKTYADKVLSSAHDFAKEEKITKTQLAEIFMANPRVAMTVCFFKQVKEADITAEIIKAYEGSTIKTMEAAIKKAVKRGLEGEERVMVGRHYGASDDFGRVHFIDMEVVKDGTKDYDTRMRLVDPRTLQYLIVNNIKYNLK